MSNKLLKFLTAVGVGVFIFPLISSAQTLNINYALSHELNVELTPTYPRPNENVSINLTLYTGDLNSATITWYQDGKLESSGKGKTNFSFKTGPVGTKTTIEIKVALLDGSTFTKTISLSPASIDMVWEADSYVPPFYEGKALYPRQGTIKIVAMPEFVTGGKRVSPANLVYKWSNDVSSYENQSGYGKNVIILNGSILGKDENIKVLATDPVSGMVAQSFLTIRPIDPQIVFYENNAYYGQIFDESISNPFNLDTGEVQILAAPYYFTKENSIKYDWHLNGQAIPSLADSMTAIFKKPAESSGQSAVSLQVTNPNRLLQEADASMNLQFKN